MNKEFTIITKPGTEDCQASHGITYLIIKLGDKSWEIYVNPATDKYRTSIQLVPDTNVKNMTLFIVYNNNGDVIEYGEYNKVVIQRGNEPLLFWINEEGHLVNRLVTDGNYDIPSDFIYKASTRRKKEIYVIRNYSPSTHSSLCSNCDLRLECETWHKAKAEDKEYICNEAIANNDSVIINKVIIAAGVIPHVSYCYKNKGTHNLKLYTNDEVFKI